MKHQLLSVAALALIAASASAQYDFSAIESGDILFTDGNIDTALGALNTGTLNRNTGISLDSDNNTLVLFTRNGSAPFGDFLIKYNLTLPTGASNPANFGGNLDDNDGTSGDVRTGSGGVAIAAGNGVALFYDIQAGPTTDEISTWSIADGTHTQVVEAALGGTEQFEYITGTSWLANESISFGGQGRLRVFDSSTGVFGPALATVATGDGIRDVDVVQNGTLFDGYYTTADNQIFRVTNLLGTPGAPINVTPGNLSAISGLEIQDMLAIDNDTFIVFDSGNEQLVFVDNNVVNIYTYAQIGSATGAPNFTLTPFFIFDHLEKRENGSTGQFELILSNNAAFTGTQASTEAAVVIVRFDPAAPPASIDAWNLYSF
ncbi:MAG: hypothetical protein ACFCU1_05665 [Sumerlaeia bacterium]